MTRFVGLLLLLIASSRFVHSEEIKDRDGTKYKCRMDDAAYTSPASTSDIFHRYRVRAGCSAGEIGGTKPHDAICIAPESERLIWTGEKIDTIAPAITPLTKACKSLAQPHPFKYSPHSSKDFVVSGEADAEYEECAYEVSFQCPSGEKGDPHIIIRSATAQVLAREIQRKSDDVAKLAKILNDKLKEK